MGAGTYEAAYSTHCDSVFGLDGVVMGGCRWRSFGRNCFEVLVGSG